MLKSPINRIISSQNLILNIGSTTIVFMSKLKYKYIVYKTTNLINSKIYIGVHKTINPDEFDGYLGNGIWIHKPCTFQKSKTAFQRAVKKYGPSNFKRETLQIFDSEIEAYHLESKIVNNSFIRRSNTYNMVVGGKMQQYKTIETYKYTLDGYFVEKFDSIKEAAISVKVRDSTLAQAVLFNRSCSGFYWSSCKVNRLDITKYNKPIKIHKVYIYNLDGSFLKEFKSCNQAELKLQISGIERAARLGYRCKQYYACFIKDNYFLNAYNKYLKTRPVFKYNCNGKCVKEYISQELAEGENQNIDISKLIKNKSADTNGFYWSLFKIDNYKYVKNKKRKVGMFDFSGKLLKTWISARQCSLEFGKGVYHTLKGDYNKHKNYIFKYLN